MLSDTPACAATTTTPVQESAPDRGPLSVRRGGPFSACRFHHVFERRRHGLPAWNALPWMDLLVEVFRAEPVGVTGAFGYGLKAIAKAMHAAGLIKTVWGDGSVDGLGAMIAGWWCDHEARARGGRMADLDLMQEVEAYNEVDCRVMAEILAWSRANR